MLEELRNTGRLPPVAQRNSDWNKGQGLVEKQLDVLDYSVTGQKRKKEELGREIKAGASENDKLALSD